VIKFMPLGDVCTDIIDCPHESPEWRSEGIAVIRNFNLANGQIDMQNGYYVDEETYKKRTRRAVPSAGDIIFSREAPIGNCAIVPDGFKCCLGQRLVLLRVNHNICSSEYLLAVLLSSYVKQQIDQVSKLGSIVSNFAIGDLHKLIIPILEDQESVAIFSSSIANKLSNNAAICSDLESMAKLLYDYWFVQFDFPDENGKTYKSSGGKMVWNEELKREIPEEWGSQSISNIATIDTVSITPRQGIKYQHYSIPAFDDNGMPAIEDGSDIKSNKYVVPENAILVSKLNPQFKRIWVVDSIHGNAICSTEFMPFVSIDSRKEYLYSVLNSDSFHTYMVQSSSSSTGSRKRIGPELCLCFLFASPKNDAIVKQYCQIIAPILNKILMLKNENDELKRLRDFILPMLMNGQVKVKGRAI